MNVYPPPPSFFFQSKARAKLATVPSKQIVTPTTNLPKSNLSHDSLAGLAAWGVGSLSPPLQSFQKLNPYLDYVCLSTIQSYLPPRRADFPGGRCAVYHSKPIKMTERATTITYIQRRAR